MDGSPKHQIGDVVLPVGVSRSEYAPACGPSRHARCNICCYLMRRTQILVTRKHVEPLRPLHCSALCTGSDWLRRRQTSWYPMVIASPCVAARSQSRTCRGRGVISSSRWWCKRMSMTARVHMTVLSTRGLRGRSDVRVCDKKGWARGRVQGWERDERGAICSARTAQITMILSSLLVILHKAVRISWEEKGQCVAFEAQIQLHRIMNAALYRSR